MNGDDPTAAGRPASRVVADPDAAGADLWPVKARETGWDVSGWATTRQRVASRLASPANAELCDGKASPDAPGQRLPARQTRRVSVSPARLRDGDLPGRHWLHLARHVAPRRHTAGGLHP